MKKGIILVGYLMLSAAFALAAPGNGTKGRLGTEGNGKGGSKQVENRALRMVKNAVQLFAANEDERAVGMLEAVARMYPESQARFRAALELGRHFTEKRNFDRAWAELRKAGNAADEDVQAEALLLQGQMQVARGTPAEAVMSLRRLVQDFPASAFANDAYFLIGQIHFEAGRWARATEAYQMVGTAIPSTTDTNAVIRTEAGQRMYVRVHDRDLAVLSSLGGTAFVEFQGAAGDVERAELMPFGRGDGDFLASVKTTVADTRKNDGLLTVRSGEPITAVYVDANTESGEENRKVLAKAEIVSSAVLSFKDGAQRQRVRGVFVDQPAFLHLRDFDLDVSDRADGAKVVVKAQYRERPEPAPGETVAPPPLPDAPWLTRDEVEVELTETGPRTGIFTGRLIPRLLPEGESPVVPLPKGEIGVHPDERLLVEYEDERNLEGTVPVMRTASVVILVGGSTEPQSIVAHSADPSVQAKKLVIEAKLLYKWGSIFKDVGLQEHAQAKADEGLKRIADVFELAAHNALQRAVLEEAYEARWNLLLVKDDLRNAIATCNGLVRRFPDTVLADRAFMQIANARLQEKTAESLRSALQVLGAIINLPNSALKAEAQFRIGEVLEEQARMGQEDGKKPDFAPAILAFKRCAETYPSSSFAGESYKRMVDYNVSIRNYSTAVEILEQVFQDYPDAPWLDEMLLKWGIVKNRMGDREGAKEKFRQLIEEYPGGKSAKTAAGFLKRLGD